VGERGREGERETLTWPTVADVAINKILANGGVAAGGRAAFVHIHLAKIPHKPRRAPERERGSDGTTS